MIDGDRVVLVVPAQGEYARTVRLTAAELASRAGMNIDGVDDVRMAVEEAFVFGAARVDGKELDFTFVLGDGMIELMVGPLLEVCASEEGADRGEKYARFILESICDSFELLVVEGACVLRLTKKTG